MPAMVMAAAIGDERLGAQAMSAGGELPGSLAALCRGPAASKQEGQSAQRHRQHTAGFGAVSRSRP